MIDKISTLEEHLGYWHNRLGQKIQLNFEQRLREYDVTLSQWCVMIGLYHQQTSTVSDLAKQLGIDNGAVTRLVDRLQAKKLIIREPHEFDARSFSLALTEQGKALVPLLAEQADRNDYSFFSALTVAEIHQYKHILTKLLQTAGVAIDKTWQEKPLKDVSPD